MADILSQEEIDALLDVLDYEFNENDLVNRKFLSDQEITNIFKDFTISKGEKFYYGKTGTEDSLINVECITYLDNTEEHYKYILHFESQIFDDTHYTYEKYSISELFGNVNIYLDNNECIIEETKDINISEKVAYCKIMIKQYEADVLFYKQIEEKRKQILKEFPHLCL